MVKKRIVITGLGVVSCFGNEVDKFYQALLEGKSGAKKISNFPCEDYTTQIAAEIQNFDSEDYIEKKQARRIDKCIAYSLVAGKKALENAGFDLTNLDRLDLKKCGVLIGSGIGGMQFFSDNIISLHEKGPRRVSPFVIPYIITNMGGGMLAMELGFMGPNYSISTACATGNYTIISAANHIRSGEADLIVCGGSEAPIVPIGLGGFCSCKALSQRNDEPEKASRPWDKDRDGFLMGEGAGVVVLESLEHAQARGAPIIAEYLGGSTSCDAYHLTDPRPDGEGVALCIKKTLEDANVDPAEVNYINAHATSTPAGDMIEVKAVKKVLGHSEDIVMNATKSMIGHSLGAAAGIEAVVVAKAIQEGKVHPTINLDNPEPDLNYHIPKEAIDHKIKVALSNSFGFGGHNASIVLGPYEG